MPFLFSNSHNAKKATVMCLTLDSGIIGTLSQAMETNERLEFAGCAPLSVDSVHSVAVRNPDLTLIDYPQQPARETAPLARLIVSIIDACPDSRVVVRIPNCTPTLADASLGLGASGCIDSAHPASSLVAALHRVLAGQTVVELPPQK